MPGFEIQEPTEEQQAVIDTGSTAIVAAGAGSGKTTVLAHRFVRLVLKEKAPVESILTLTFTKKATNEMRQRIYQFLAARQEGGSEQEEALLETALKDFYKARIETLDAYCASIVRAACARYGLAPDFSEDMEKSAAIIEEESLAFVIKHRNHPAIKELYREKTPETIAREVFARTIAKHCSLGEPVDFAADFAANERKILEDWRAITAGIQTLLNNLEDTQRTLAGDISAKKAVPLSIPALDFGAASGIEETVRSLCALAYTSLNRNPAKMLKKEITALREAFALFAPLAVFIMQRDHMRTLCGLLNDFEQTIFERKRKEGALSYADAASLARRILLEHQELRREEKQKFTHIIIDEFQDNNALQRDILYLLAEKPDRENEYLPQEDDLVEGKLFFVGDEKQSIYKFRGADVSVFRELQKSFPQGNHTLQTNFRSSHTLIGFFNAFFGGTDYSETKEALPARFPAIFARGADLPPYEAAYTPLQTCEAKKNIDGKAVICLLPMQNSRSAAPEDPDEDDEEDTAETEAVFVVKKIKELQEAGHCAYNDIAILVRSHTNEHFFEKHLRSMDIPYTNENVSASIAVDPVSDIHAFLRLVSYPMDKLAYAHVLRSPFTGLSFAGTLAALKTFDETLTPFTQTPEAMAECDREKWELCRARYAETKKRSTGLSIAGLVSYLWYEQGYRYEALWHHETRAYNSVYHLLFTLAVNADEAGTSLAAFTDRLKHLIDGRRFVSGAQGDPSWLDDFTVPLEKENAVSLMTIHKSKGLQFPVVFVCGCGGRSRHREASFAYRTRDNTIALVPVFPARLSGLDPRKVRKNYFQEKAADAENAKERAELRRLLYVAMTRAERELYLTGTLAYTKDDNDGVDFSTLLKSVCERKAQKTPSAIEGDTILDDGTFLGLMLPVIAARMDEGLFELETIPPGGAADGGKKPDAASANDEKGRAAFIEAAAPLYREENTVAEETPYRVNQSVTHRKKFLAQDFPARYENAPALSGPGAQDVFARIEPLLDGEDAAGELGTIVHACVRAALTHTAAALPALIAGKRDGEAAEQLLEAGKEAAARFLASPLGMMAQGAAVIRSEYPFRTLAHNALLRETGDERGALFINGTIDLAFEAGGTIYVVDFKTGKQEKAAEHAYQMAVYHKAARDLWQKDTRLILYWLRTGNAVEVTTPEHPAL